MPTYSVYTKCSEGGRRDRAYSFTADDDAAAERFVLGRTIGLRVELWSYSRLVARYEGSPPPFPL